ncbi:MAG TPA: LptF/LptG family permease [Candidatus Sulfopaludibacter sp.]|nr:LptF/LptG family permease [Candidatus Sulfopaludibacter sp.]
MLRLLGRYVFREILTSAVLGTLLATFIIFLRAADKLFALLVNSNNVGALDILKLFAWALPPVLPETIPFGVLVGILIGLGRLSSDGEIVAMRAAGVSSRRVIAPVLLFAAIGAAIAGYSSLRLAPRSVLAGTVLFNKIAETQLSADIEPRVFVENFPNKILYVGDVQPGPVAKWLPVFIADVTPPSQRSSGMKDKADGPLVMVAREAIAVSDYRNNRVQLSLADVATHEMGKDGVSNDERAVHKLQALDASPPEQKAFRSDSMTTTQLQRYRGPDWIEAQVELHKRYALPVACIVLAMVGIPLGIATRKGGKSAGYVIALFLGFFCYYLSLVSLISVARARTIPIPMAVWLPDAAFFVAGVIFLYRMEKPGDRDVLASMQALLAPLARLFRRAGRKAEERPGGAAWRLPLLPQIVDTYVLSNFLFYIGIVLASLVSMILVYNFFELMGDSIHNKIPLSKMFQYLFFLTPEEIYEQLPISILVGVLINLGVLSKNNEITAFKACGVSLYRLAAPILLGSTLFSGALFGFDYLYVPAANLRQEALRDLIKGRTSSRQRPDRKWMMGYNNRIYFYRYFDTIERAMNDVYVFELEPGTFRLQREIIAARATWSPLLNTWIFENGWSCTFTGPNCTQYRSFKLDAPANVQNIQATTFPELTETPEYFLKEMFQDKQMNFLQLETYMNDLAHRGIPTTKLQVQFYRKFALPLFGLIMAALAVPFGFMVGNRGAMTAIGVSLGIALVYQALNTLFEKLGNVNQLPPSMAAWSPDVVFGLVGLYFLLRMRS